MVLIAVGALDIAVMVYCIVNDTSYSSSLNIFAVVAGVFLVRGSLVAAGIVRSFSVLLLATICAGVIAWPLLEPPDLTITQIRLSPISTAISAVFLVAAAWLLFWIQRRLGEQSVLAATTASGKKVRSMWVPAAIGLALVVLLASVIPSMRSGASGLKATAMAREQMGTGYNYHVSSMSRFTTDSGTHVTARVTVWNKKKVSVVPVEWRE